MSAFTFEPSSYSVDPGYGSTDDRYGAQVALTTWQEGADYGAVDPSALGAAVDGVVGLATAGIAIGHQAKQAKAQRQHEMALAKEQAKLVALQAQAASYGTAASDEGGSTVLLVLGGLALVLTVGAGGYYFYTKSQD